MAVVYLLFFVFLIILTVLCVKELPNYIHNFRMKSREIEKADLQNEILKEKRDNEALNYNRVSKYKTPERS